MNHKQIANNLALYRTNPVVEPYTMEDFKTHNNMSPSSSSSRSTPHSSLDENTQERVVRASRTRRSGRPAIKGPRQPRRTRGGALTVQAPAHRITAQQASQRACWIQYEKIGELERVINSLRQQNEQMANTNRILLYNMEQCRVDFDLCKVRYDEMLKNCLKYKSGFSHGGFHGYDGTFDYVQQSH